jgi:outer membrane protein OmpA-like peptidoglycan-associated protein
VAATPDTLTSPVHWAVVQDGRVYLRGRLPNQADADTIIAKAAGVVGPERVVVEYAIDPAAPVVESGPVFVADTVLFEPDSVAIGPQFRSILDLGRLLLLQNPKVTITVVGRADSRGDPDYNLALSARRAEVVIDYVVAAGIERSRLVPIAAGASRPIADESSPEGLQQNRSVEFVVFGILDD